MLTVENGPHKKKHEMVAHGQHFHCSSAAQPARTCLSTDRSRISKQTNGICTVYYLQSFRYCPTIITISIILCFWSYFFERNFLFIYFFWPFWAEHFIWHPWHIKIVNWCLLSVHLASATSTMFSIKFICDVTCHGSLMANLIGAVLYSVLLSKKL